MVINPTRLARFNRLPLPLKNVVAEERLIQVRGCSVVDAVSVRLLNEVRHQKAWVVRLRFMTDFLIGTPNFGLNRWAFWRKSPRA